MEDPTEPSDPVKGKTPAPVTPASTPRRSRATKRAAPSKKAAAKKSPAKRTTAKKAAAKKSPARKSPAKRTPAKKAPAKKAPAKKTAAKDAPAASAPKPAARKPAAKKAAPKKPAAKKSAPRPKKKPDSVFAAAAPSEVRHVPSTRAPDPIPSPPHLTVVSGGDEPPPRLPVWALCATVGEDLLNDLAALAVGAGVELDPLDTSVALPGMGEVDVRLQLTITEGRFDLRSGDGGRARVVVRALGDVSTRAVAYDAAPSGDELGPTGMPAPPAPIPVRVEALVTPFVELWEDHKVSIGLDLADAELVSLGVDPDAPTPDGVDEGAWSAMLGMFSMVFSVLGGGLFDSLGEHLGSTGLELGADVGRVLADLGVAPGRADVSIASGLLTIGLAASPGVRGRAVPAPVAGRRMGIAAATSVVDAVAQMLIARSVGGLPVPFEVDVDLGEQQVAGRIRQPRVLPASFPDLRSSLRTEVRTRLVRSRLELVVQSAWVELPSVVPSFVNDISRRLGGLASLAPMRVKFPATIGVPLPGTDDEIGIEIDDLRVASDGIGLVVALG